MLSKKSSVILSRPLIFELLQKKIQNVRFIKKGPYFLQRSWLSCQSDFFLHQIFRLDEKPSRNVSVFIFRHKLCKRSNFFCWPTALHIVCKFLAISKKVNFLWSTSFRGTFISFPIWWGAISQSCHSWTVWDIFWV